MALLNEVFKNEQIKITVQGALQDSAIVGTTTFIGGLTAGSGGAIVGNHCSVNLNVYQ